MSDSVQTATLKQQEAVW